MPRIGPISRRDLVHYLRRCSFDGPFPGGDHQYMIRGDVRAWIPNPHQGDISRPLLVKLLQQAGISREDWEAL